ncbi:TIGR01906 family membrane protein [Tissierella sp. Yu-01]|uniref:TIGR01906 family membrane protein n=1 Tax=Tissierella sp. Yu-01 TaxID=3035694 RepID=UPI00240DC5D9|nr:TIGR01906 family membrane protein [Tissierella sp. Yu-01]WFA10427.1 TIGR01906 family membrane protein [Tissierella sp. Yu-01]
MLVVILIISISVAMLMIAIEKNAYNKSYYLKSFEKYNIEEVTGKSMDDLEEITDSLIAYLKGEGYDELLIPHFNEKEVAHMRDVQDLFDQARLIKFFSIAISVILIIYFGVNYGKKTLGKVLFYGLFSNHVIVILLALVIATDFNKYWTIFHHIFFTNDLWLLNPKTDLMIQMLPEQFFSGIALNLMLSFFIYLAIIQLVGLYYMKKGRGKWKGLKI